jgi:uncharacterized protein (DUF1015 family)
MADVRPFRGLRYNTLQTSDLSAIICPPYDAITPLQQEEFYLSNPYNMVRLELGRSEAHDTEGENAHTRAGQQLRNWRREKVLVQEKRPAFYLLEQTYREKNVTRRSHGLFACVRLEEYENGVILPHEHTVTAPKEDRLKLMQACHANLSPLMVLYRDPGGLGDLLKKSYQSEPSYVAKNSEDVTYKLWVVDDKEIAERVHSLFTGKPLYIADGHHRYETSLVYREMRRTQAQQQYGNEAHNFSLMGLLDLDDPGLELLSFHRILFNLSPEALRMLEERVLRLFNVEVRPLAEVTEVSLARLFEEIESSPRGAPVYGLLTKEPPGLRILRLRERLPDSELPQAQPIELAQCDTWVLHASLLDPVLGKSGAQTQVKFVHGFGEVTNAFSNPTCNAVFLTRSIEKQLFASLAQQGLRLPAKTTYFYPKLPTGLVIAPLDKTLVKK